MLSARAATVDGGCIGGIHFLCLLDCVDKPNTLLELPHLSTSVPCCRARGCPTVRCLAPSTMWQLPAVPTPHARLSPPEAAAAGATSRPLLAPPHTPRVPSPMSRVDFVSDIWGPCHSPRWQSRSCVSTLGAALETLPGAHMLTQHPRTPLRSLGQLHPESVPLDMSRLHCSRDLQAPACNHCPDESRLCLLCLWQRVPLNAVAGGRLKVLVVIGHAVNGLLILVGSHVFVNGLGPGTRLWPLYAGSTSTTGCQLFVAC